jgi:hypothetical protein
MPRPVFPPSPPGRSAAEHARDILERSASAHVLWLDARGRCSGRIPGVVIDPYADEAATRAVVEIADAAPLPLRDRIRARLRIHGHADFDEGGDGLLRIHPLAISLEVDGQDIPISANDLATAEPDPFAVVEGQLLSHLASAHPREYAALRRLLPGELAEAHVVPLAVDSHGLTLRAELRAGHRDVVLAFGRPARTGEDLRRELDLLARRSADISAVFRAGPAAARICDPEP